MPYLGRLYVYIELKTPEGRKVYLVLMPYLGRLHAYHLRSGSHSICFRVLMPYLGRLHAYWCLRESLCC